jgi:putative transposase
MLFRLQPGLDRQTGGTTMYDWRKMTDTQRRQTLEERFRRRFPFHTPPHFISSGSSALYHLTAACYGHCPIIGTSPERMAAFENALTALLQSDGRELRFWCVLPNHWHALVRVADMKETAKSLGRLHGRLSRAWNLEDGCPGRTCWHGCADRAIRSDAHYHATVNYILNNPVHHGYAETWRDWPCSNARDYLDTVGRDEAERRWRAYPVREYGKGWDDANV